MMAHSSVDAARYAALYQSTLVQAAQAGESIMGNMLASARQSLKGRLRLARDFVERDHLEQAVKLLDSQAGYLCEHYPPTLKAAFQALSPRVPEGDAGGRPVDRMALLASVNFSQLGLMDSSQVHERVALARVQQAVMLTAETALSVLNTYICATQGLPAVQPERNPLRVEAYVQALHKLIAETKAPAALQLDWVQHMSEALGPELNHLYGVLSTQLAAQGVKAVGYAAVPSYAATGQPSGRSAAFVNPSTLRAAGLNPVTSPSSGSPEPVLTLDRLRRLLVGELEPVPIASAVDRFAAQFAREFESGGDFSENAAFQATVPAALEALQDMQQVDHLVERLDQRRHALLAGDAGQKTGSGPRATTREQLHRSASGLGQVLSLEVVSLMVDNIVHDERMLDPIKDVIKHLEPALLQLAIVDPRFFSDKQHPARRLLEEITQRSLAFENLASPGLTEFLQPLHSTLGALVDSLIDDALAFEQALPQ